MKHSDPIFVINTFKGMNLINRILPRIISIESFRFKIDLDFKISEVCIN